MNEAMVVICGKDSDNFDGHFKGSTGWFNLDNEFKKKSVVYLNRTSIIFFIKRTLAVKTWNHIKSFDTV